MCKKNKLSLVPPAGVNGFEDRTVAEIGNGGISARTYITYENGQNHPHPQKDRVVTHFTLSCFCADIVSEEYY